VHEPLARCHLYPHSDVAVARIPPIVPDTRLDDRCLALTKNAGLSVAFHRQLTIEHRKLLDEMRVTVFPHHTRADERRELGRRAPAGIVPGTLQDRRAFSGDGVLPNLPDFYRGAVRLAVRVGMQHVDS
jgi:hypothetical protein